ncbi:MAG: carbamoyl-phosphate synthase large subunit [Phycisphaeraceae bacterium]|nr:carbamoyl-phosphate synthase large subunit [Phycisphaeraceae bacterium]
MPKRDDIRTILLLGSGPIVIGQGCEFDYSGAQACKALREEGYRVVLVNSNPATIMTDPAMADRTYIEPITPEAVAKVLAREAEAGCPVDAILPTLGGQTALNVACALWDSGTLQRMGVAMIGAGREVIRRAEDREAFSEVCASIGVATPRSRAVRTLREASEFLEEIGTPAIIRPAYTLGGWGGGIAYNAEEFRTLVARGLGASMIGQVQIDASLIGWKEFELEVVRDTRDNCIIVCGIENFDPMGVHTGDSITVAPILTLTDKEYQVLRDAAIAIMRAVGVETGGSNVQFAVNPDPEDGKFQFVVVEMNPRVSRSSALASKATGFPIARIAAKLAVGYTLDELRNDITGTTSACFEPAIDYVVTKIPRWTFEKFPEADETLTTQMKSVGEVMAIGRSFKESFQKAIRSLDVKRFGLGLDRNDKWLAAMRAVETGQLVLDYAPEVPPAVQQAQNGPVAPDPTPDSPAKRPDLALRTADGQPIEWPIPTDKLIRKLSVPCQGRPYFIRYALKMGWSVERICELTRIDRFFIDEMSDLVAFEDELCQYAALEDVPADVLARAKRLGYSDPQLAHLFLGALTTESILAVRARRKGLGIEPVYKQVDTCAAEFEAITPYYYSTYERTSHDSRDSQGGEPSRDRGVLADEVRVAVDPKVIILGGGPNRIGQGIEFDYCCCHAAYAARDMGVQSVMINCNPETVSTDFDTSDLLFFEPLTLEDVMNVYERLDRGPGPGLPSAAIMGAIVQFGGQTPLNLAHGLVAAGARIIGTSLDSIDLAEDRDRFDALLERLKLQRPASGIARSLAQAREIAGRIGYPVLVRPSYVLGGRGMEICADEAALVHFMTTAIDISDLDGAPVLIDKFLAGAIEVDVDVVADHGGEGQAAAPQALICGIMQHIEHAGVHSGDSACSIPPWSLPKSLVRRIADLSRTLARELKVRGLMNLQLAIRDDEVFVLEVNPRASRTAPFVSKATHVPWPAIAAKVMMGSSLADLGVREVTNTGAFAIKESVFPHQKFPGVDFVLGPEMRSTGEVMGIDLTMPVAYLKALMASGTMLPSEGGVFLSVRDSDKDEIVDIARSLISMGFVIHATGGTAALLKRHGMKPVVLEKIAAGARPNVIDLMTDGRISLVINTPTRTGWQSDEGRIRATAVRLSIPMITTITGAQASVRAIEARRAGDWDVRALQDYRELASAVPGGSRASLVT